MHDVQSLEPEIYAILTAPAVDLNTVSAKRVRAQLKHNIPELGDDWVREHKEQIDKLTAHVFDRVRAGATQPPISVPPISEPPPQPTPSAAAPVPSPPPPTANTGKRKRSAEEEADAEYARQLASELNGHNTRGGSAGAGRKKGGSKKKAKSAKEIQDSDDEGEDESSSKKPSRPKKAKTKAKKKAEDEGEDGAEKKKGGFQKEYSLSPAMAEFTGVQSLSRTQIVKKLWEHIKANNLQNPEDKREILCDERMKHVFGVDRINMFKMNKLIGDHVFDNAE